MTGITGYCRLPHHGEQGYDRAPWWGDKAPPTPEPTFASRIERRRFLHRRYKRHKRRERFLLSLLGYSK